MRMALLQLVLLLAHLWTSSFEIVELNHFDNDLVMSKTVEFVVVLGVEMKSG